MGWQPTGWLKYNFIVMHVSLDKSAVLAVALVLAWRGLPDEPVRTELIRLQKESGLTLASFYRNVQTVNFVNREVSHQAVLFPGGIPQEGQLSRDGTRVAAEVATDHRRLLAVGGRDGSGFREYPEIAGAYDICWSYDQSALALMSGGLLKLDLTSGVTRKIDTSGYLTSQCWSPGGRQIVYSSAGSVRVFDFGTEESRELTKGTEPTWSPDGQWIAFRDGDAFYAIRSSGEGKKLLFKVADARSPLWWSPDSRFVAYWRYGARAFWDVLHAPVSALQLRVRRLADNSEDHVFDFADKGYVPSCQWIQSQSTR